MTQFLSGALAGFLVGGFVGVITSALLFAAKGDAYAQARSDEEQMEALIANRIEHEIVAGARLLN